MCGLYWCSYCNCFTVILFSCNSYCRDSGGISGLVSGAEKDLVNLFEV